MAPTTASNKGIVVSLLSAVTTGTGLGVSLPISSNLPRVHLRGNGTTSGGTIVIEEAQDPLFSGTWSLLQTVQATTITASAEQVIHIWGTISAIRARVTSNITGGGTVTVELVSN